MTTPAAAAADPIAADAATIGECHIRYLRDQHPGDLARLVAHYEPLVDRLAQRFFRHGEPVDDLRQVGFEALLGALKRFDPERGTPFTSFAAVTIAGALKRHYRDRGWSMRVPRSVHDTYQRMRSLSDELAQRHGRPPTVAELAAGLGLSQDTVIEVMAAHTSRSPESYDAMEGSGDGLARAHAGEAQMQDVVDRETLRQLLAPLPPDQRHLLRLYFVEERSQAEIGGLLGVSQMQVSRLLRRTLDCLRTRVEAGVPG